MSHPSIPHTTLVQPFVTEGERVQFLLDRINELGSLPEGWHHEDEEDYEDTSHRSPPSKETCLFVKECLLKRMRYMPNGWKLPHICPMEDYPGLDLWWMGNLSIRVYDALTFKDGSILESTVSLTCAPPGGQYVHHQGLTSEVTDVLMDSFFEYIM